MKQFFVFGVAGMALATSPQVLAQSSSTITQDGVGNAATVTQTGTNTTTIEQIGDANTATSEQAGTSNTTEISQTGDGLFFASAFQDGTNMQITIDQIGASQDSAIVIQDNGSNFIATITQDGVGGPESANRVDLRQLDGANSTATIYQGATATNPVGERALASVTSTGSDHRVTIAQAGFASTTFTVQFGTGNIVTINQAENSGAFNGVDNEQFGDRNLSAAVQDGGDGNTAQTFTLGNDNEAYFNQGFAGGNNNFARAEQSGDDNDSTINQNLVIAGASNTANVFQYSDGNVSTIGQEGTGNTATVTQGTPPIP